MSFWDVEHNLNKGNITFEDTIAKRDNFGGYLLAFSKEELKKGSNFAQVKKKKKKKRSQNHIFSF